MIRVGDPVWLVEEFLDEFALPPGTEFAPRHRFQRWRVSQRFAGLLGERKHDVEVIGPFGWRKL